jgi:broad-specificity NMP kinase
VRVIIISGIPGAGKTIVARMLATRSAPAEDPASAAAARLDEAVIPG